MTSLNYASATLTALAVVLGLVSPPAAAERKSITYYNQTGPVVSRTSASPGDRPDHELVQATRQDMTTSPDADWNDVPVLNFGQSDLVAGSGTVSGYAVRTHKNGDKTFYTYQGRIRAVAEGDARYTVGEGTVELTGGTGKFANARGSGTWKAVKGGLSTIRMDLEY
jgi:hypothetical protein